MGSGERIDHDRDISLLDDLARSFHREDYIDHVILVLSPFYRAVEGAEYNIRHI